MAMARDLARRDGAWRRVRPRDLLTKVLACHAVGQRNVRPVASAAAALYGNDPGVHPAQICERAIKQLRIVQTASVQHG